MKAVVKDIEEGRELTGTFKDSRTFRIHGFIWRRLWTNWLNKIVLEAYICTTYFFRWDKIVWLMLVKGTGIVLHLKLFKLTCFFAAFWSMKKAPLDRITSYWTVVIARVFCKICPDIFDSVLRDSKIALTLQTTEKNSGFQSRLWFGTKVVTTHWSYQKLSRRPLQTFSLAFPWPFSSQLSKTNRNDGRWPLASSFANIKAILKRTASTSKRRNCVQGLDYDIKLP